jgi:hypothetical protein
MFMFLHPCRSKFTRDEPGFSWHPFSEYLLIYIEMNCVAILLVRFVMDKVAARRDRAFDSLQQTQPVPLRILLSVFSYAAMRLFYMIALHRTNWLVIVASCAVFLTAVS